MPGILTPGVLLAHQIRTISTNRVVNIRGPLKDPVLQRAIVEAILVLLDIAPPAPPATP
jgi:mRNA-degrading endonuclease toxin of MazEF toxin-antitoxin module